MGRITPSFRQLYEEKISALEPLFSDLDLSRYRVMAFLIYVLRGISLRVVSICSINNFGKVIPILVHIPLPLIMLYY
jgi:hypothetical protein